MWAVHVQFSFIYIETLGKENSLSTGRNLEEDQIKMGDSPQTWRTRGDGQGRRTGRGEGQKQ